MGQMLDATGGLGNRDSKHQWSSSVKYPDRIPLREDGKPIGSVSRLYRTFTRSDGGGLGYLLYDVNLSTGQVTNGRAVGGGLDFTGGLALIVPEPTSLGFLIFASVPLLMRRKRA